MNLINLKPSHLVVNGKGYTSSNDNDYIPQQHLKWCNTFTFKDCNCRMRSPATPLMISLSEKKYIPSRNQPKDQPEIKLHCINIFLHNDYSTNHSSFGDKISKRVKHYQTARKPSTKIPNVKHKKL